MYVIITTKSLIWLMLSLCTLLLMLSAYMSSSWLIGKQSNEFQNNTYTPSVGIYTRCTFIKTLHCGPFNWKSFSTDNEVFPSSWKATMFFIALGLTIMGITVLFGVISCCNQSIFRKSIFNISGAMQACAGISYIMGIMLYPIAWSEPRVQRLCSSEAASFYPGSCSIGWGLYSAGIATALTFVCAYMSVYADKSTSSDRVQNKIDEGRTLICLV